MALRHASLRSILADPAPPSAAAPQLLLRGGRGAVGVRPHAAPGVPPPAHPPGPSAPTPTTSVYHHRNHFLHTEGCQVLGALTGSRIRSTPANVLNFDFGWHLDPFRVRWAQTPRPITESFTNPSTTGARGRRPQDKLVLLTAALFVGLSRADLDAPRLQGATVPLAAPARDAATRPLNVAAHALHLLARRGPHSSALEMGGCQMGNAEGNSGEAIGNCGQRILVCRG